jgi:hypothetical protein
MEAANLAGQRLGHEYVDVQHVLLAVR